MQAFDYATARSVEEAVSLLLKHDGQACVLSGGTDLLVQLREGQLRVRLLVDIKPVPEANELRYDPTVGLQLGAAVPCHRI
ncbi:MAG: FAD binding domain-containing protein, partial [Anaerolineae bacterium]